MFTFFHGWRRKLGCITLVMACAFCTLWVRSLRFEDQVILALGSNSLEAQSERGVLELMIHRVFNAKPEEFGIDRSSWYSEELPLIVVDESGYYTELIEETGLDWRRQRKIEFSGFRYSRGELFDASGDGLVETKLIGFRYWFVSIPMTLLSVWLIVLKPRKCPAMPQQTEAPHA